MKSVAIFWILEMSGYFSFGKSVQYEKAQFINLIMRIELTLVQQLWDNIRTKYKKLQFDDGTVRQYSSIL